MLHVNRSQLLNVPLDTLKLDLQGKNFNVSCVKNPTDVCLKKHFRDLKFIVCGNFK